MTIVPGTVVRHDTSARHRCQIRRKECITAMEKNLDYVKIIRDLREDADKTQQEIADVLHTSQTMYARYERGANELPLHHLLTLCEYYDVSADYILGKEK